MKDPTSTLSKEIGFWPWLIPHGLTKLTLTPCARTVSR